MDSHALSRLLRLFLAIPMAMLVADATAAVSNFINFETAPVHPVALGPDGRTLAVCNLPDNRVEFFDVSSGLPVSAGSVPVGLDPVSARFASSNELWVVNHISSTISIVDVAAQNVVATLETPAGPSDLVFAGTPRRAWISCSRTNAVFVVDPITRTAVTNIAIEGERPRAMAASPDGAKVYVAIFESGNGTTIIAPPLTELSVPPPPGPVQDPNGPYSGADPPPNSGASFSPARIVTNTPPRVAHIVRKNATGHWMDDNKGDWTEWVSGTNAAQSGRIAGWDLPDRDVAIIDTSTWDVTYAHRLMNICMAMGVNPVSGEIAVVGTEATNERRFEPVLNGVFLRVNLALVDPVARTNRLRDLNPHLDYLTRTLPPAQRALSLGDPRGIEWSADGARAYITGMGSRNLIIINTDGQRAQSQPIELGEGPTGLALDEPRARLYVWNRFSSSLSVVDTTACAVLTNVPVFDPTPDIVRRGRRHLYDTRKTSGLGIASCASCHVDARGDRLAWDLGDPAGNLVTNAGFVFHPMKGPMVTQTLQDIITPTNFNGQTLSQQPLHWRGDRKGIEDFNHTFTTLQSASEELTTNEMAEFKAMLASTFFPPNSLRTFSNSLPALVPLPGLFGRMPTNGSPRPPLPPGSAQRGFTKFNQSNCRICHDFNQGRDVVDGQLLALPRSGTQGAFKSSQLRSLAEKLGFDGMTTNSRAGFGFMHDGGVDTLTTFLVKGFPEVVSTDQSIADMIAFLLCFSGSDLTINPSSASQDVPAATGRQVTFNSSTPPPLLDAMFALALRTNSRVELVLRGSTNAAAPPRQWLLRRATQSFQSDRHGEIAPSLATVIAAAAPGNEFTAILVPEGSGQRLALDRDGDGYYNASEVETGFDPADSASHPGRIVSITPLGTNLVLGWQSAPGARYSVLAATNLTATPALTLWTPLGLPFLSTNSLTFYTDTLPSGLPRRFYRVRLEP
jgi:YVTN family beta-propeller protein